MHDSSPPKSMSALLQEQALLKIAHLHLGGILVNYYRANRALVEVGSKVNGRGQAKTRSFAGETTVSDLRNREQAGIPECRAQHRRPGVVA